MLATDELYWKVKEYTDDAKAIAFDTCHKIYILLDDNQVTLSRSYGYGEKGDDLITAEQMNSSELATVLTTWYNHSCSLKFINAVATNPDGTDNFISVVDQFENLDDEDEDDEDM